MFLCSLNRRTNTLDRQGLYQKDTVLGPLRGTADVLNFVFETVAKLIKTQTVSGWVDQSCQLCFEHRVLRCIEQTLKYGILNPLAAIDAGLCNFTQPSPAVGGFGIDVVSD